MKAPFIEVRLKYDSLKSGETNLLYICMNKKEGKETVCSDEGLTLETSAFQGLCQCFMSLKGD